MIAKIQMVQFVQPGVDFPGKSMASGLQAGQFDLTADYDIRVLRVVNKKLPNSEPREVPFERIQWMERAPKVAEPGKTAKTAST